MDAGLAGLIASRLAPTGGLCWIWILYSLKIECGSELARDGGGSVNEDVECAGLFASKLAPTGILCWI
jgi:hypothetical protein